MYTTNELENMKGYKIGQIINEIYNSHHPSKLNKYTKTSYCGRYIFTKHKAFEFDMTYSK